MTLNNKNVCVGEGGRRTSVRLEPVVWDGLREICHREGVTLAALVGAVKDADPDGNLSSNLRMHVLGYYRAAATDAGHAKAGHGSIVEVAA